MDASWLGLVGVARIVERVCVIVMLKTREDGIELSDKGNQSRSERE